MMRLCVESRLIESVCSISSRSIAFSPAWIRLISRAALACDPMGPMPRTGQKTVAGLSNGLDEQFRNMTRGELRRDATAFN